MKQGSAVAALAVLLAAGAPAGAQEATIYRDTGYSGPAVAVSEEKPDMGLRFNVNAIRIQSGTWELCPERNFRGNCLKLDRSSSNLFAQHGWSGRLGSMRPVSDQGWGGSGGGSGSDNPSLRGMSAEFFPRPAERGRRILACPGGSGTVACAERTATEWCRRVGWSRAAHTRMETVNRATYLVDTLCVRG